MAITITRQIAANTYVPSSNPINFTITSNNNGKCNFRYVCDVYIDNVKVFRYKLFPDPNSGYGFIQAGNVINDYLSEFMPNEDELSIKVAYSTTQKSTVKVYMKFGEEFDNSLNCDGDIILYPDLATSNTFYAFYAAIPYEEWPSFDVSQWTTSHVDNPSKDPINWTTNRPLQSAKCDYADSYYLDYLVEEGIITDTHLMIELDSGATYSIDPLPTTDWRRNRVTCGPYNINKYYETPIINQSTKYYDVWVQYDQKELTKKFRITLQKPKTYKTRIGFIGLMGSPEYITFYNRNIKNYNFDRRSYKKYLTSRVGTNWTYAVGDRETTQYSNTTREVHDVSTFVTPNESKWLSELWMSNNVWVEERPRIIPFEIYLQTSTGYMLMRMPEGHGVLPGDFLYLIPENLPTNVDYVGRFQVERVNGRVLDLGFEYSTYNLTTFLCGWAVVEEDVRRIPIVVSDEFIEEKEKTGGLISYSLRYETSVNKITLR
jgi:hypothetical protein